MFIYYRISDAVDHVDKLKKTKAECLSNFLSMWFLANVKTQTHQDQFILIRDSLSEQTWEMINPIIKYIRSNRHVVNKPIVLETHVGNAAQCFLSALQEALKLQNDDEFAYFVEDEYLHLFDARKILLEGLGRADYVSLYDRRDKYVPEARGTLPLVDGGGEHTVVFTSDSSHWKITCASTMTFASKVRTLKEDSDIFLGYPQGKYPSEIALWTAVRDKGRKLITPIPGHSTNIERQWLSPFVDWDNVY